MIGEIMAKKQVKITVDEEYVNKVKENDLKLSGLVNEYLKELFSYEGSSVHQINREIKENEAKIEQLARENNRLNKMRKQLMPVTLEARKQKMWMDFRIEFNHAETEQDFDKILRMDAEELLGYSFIDLCMMCKLFFERQHTFDCPTNQADQWEVIEKEYGEDEFYKPEYKDYHLKGFFNMQ